MFSTVTTVMRGDLRYGCAVRFIQNSSVMPRGKRAWFQESKALKTKYFDSHIINFSDDLMIFSCKSFYFFNFLGNHGSRTLPLSGWLFQGNLSNQIHFNDLEKKVHMYNVNMLLHDVGFSLCPIS